MGLLISVDIFDPRIIERMGRIKREEARALIESLVTRLSL